MAVNVARAGCCRCPNALVASGPDAGVVLLALWPLAQIYPQSFLFGLGQLLPILSDWLSQLLDM